MPALPTSQFESKVINLGETLFALPGNTDDRHRLGYPVRSRPVRDVRRSMAAFQPDVVHAWEPWRFTTSACSAPIGSSSPIPTVRRDDRSLVEQSSQCRHRVR
ncbi:MAG: hypothetical protein U0798_19775 [Gemmataceae bacterium]